MNPDYSRTAQRAEHRCEYCRAPEAIFNFPFEVEHIVPPYRGGIKGESNLTLSCRSCNVFKADQTEAVDAETGEIVLLFNPRRDPWQQHFDIDNTSGRLVGLTPVGRATIHVLQMNEPAQLAARKQWIRLKLFPGTS